MFHASGTVPEAPGGRSVTWAATGRFGGESKPPFDSLNLAPHVGDDPLSVAANCATVARALACRGIASFGAVHGGECRYVNSPGVIQGIDAVWTNQPGLALMAMGADCAVVGIIGHRTIAAVHCGWKGLVADVMGAAVHQIREVDEVRRVIIGPAICGACYPIPQERADLVMDSAANGPGVLVVTPDGQPGIDVRAGVRARLRSLGLDDGLIESVPGCTREDEGLFSVRRDTRTGRHGMVVVIDDVDVHERSSHGGVEV